jgi:hypothetical protein
MSSAFSICHVGELSGQNRCASGTRNKDALPNVREKIILCLTLGQRSTFVTIGMQKILVITSLLKSCMP